MCILYNSRGEINIYIYIAQKISCLNLGDFLKKMQTQSNNSPTTNQSTNHFDALHTYQQEMPLNRYIYDRRSPPNTGGQLDGRRQHAIDGDLILPIYTLEWRWILLTYYYQTSPNVLVVYKIVVFQYNRITQASTYALCVFFCREREKLVNLLNICVYICIMRTECMKWAHRSAIVLLLSI